MPRIRRKSTQLEVATPRYDGGEALNDAAETFKDRQQVYKDNYLRLANAMVGMYPQGLTLHTQEDWIRLYFFMATITKMSRYATNWDDGGHTDSIRDAAVYAAMLQAWDER